MVDKVYSILTPQTPALQSKLYFTVDLIEDTAMGSKWPNFPTDYLESRRDSIYDQIHQNDLNVNGVHVWLLDQGPWVSKNQLRDALADWVDEEPSAWRPLPDLDAYIRQKPRPTVDDLLEEYGNPYDDEREDPYNGRRNDYPDGRGNYEPQDNYVKRKIPERQGGYGGMDEYDDRRAHNDGQDRNDARRNDYDQNDDKYQNDGPGNSYGDIDDYYDEEDEVPIIAEPPKPVPPRTSIRGLGQTMASKYEPGLRSQIGSSTTKKELSKHRTYNFFESILKPDSPWTNPDPNVPLDPGPEAPPELAQVKPSRPIRPDMPEAYPVAEDPLQDLDAQYGPGFVPGVKANGGVTGEWWEGGGDEIPLMQEEQQMDPQELEERARKEKEYNDYDWQMFMQAVKQG